MGRRLAHATRPRDLTGWEDGASRLARLLISADKVRFLVGAPWREVTVDKLMDDLKARGKLVSAESSCM